jgi:hypothetical protein
MQLSQGAGGIGSASCFGVRQCLNERSSRSNKSLAGEVSRSRGGGRGEPYRSTCRRDLAPIALWNNLTGSGISHGDLQGLRD